MKSDDMFALGQYTFSGKERVESLLEQMAGSHGYANAMLKSGALLLALNGTFLFLIFATSPPLAFSCFMIVAGMALTVLVIDRYHSKLVVTPDRVARISPFPFLRWEMERSRIVEIGYSVRQKSGEYLTFEDETGSVKGTWICPSLRESFIEAVPKSQRWEM